MWRSLLHSIPLHNSRTQTLAALHLCGRNYENLERVAAQCRQIAPVEGLSVTTSYGDVGVEQDVRRMCNEFRSAHGDGVEILVANAGLNRVGAVEDISSADFDLVMNTNLKGKFCLRC